MAAANKQRLKELLCFKSHNDSDTNAVNQIGPSPTNNPEAIETRRLRSQSSGSSEMPEEKKPEVWDELKALNPRNLITIKDVALTGVKGEPINDKTYLMERIIQLAADLPVQSVASDTLTHNFLTELWNDLDHPPKSYLGNNFIFRRADGSNNNPLLPHIGAANQPYARSVRPRKMQPIDRPDPGVVFDTLLARKSFKPHPNRISAVLFYVASIIIHDIFHTSHKDFNISETSSYLDLSPLYGNNEEQQMSVRTQRGGMLKPDTFWDVRILGFPPGVGLLLIMFNRFHNNVADNLARIDEGGRFSKILQSKTSIAGQSALVQYDEALFQTARLVTTGLYSNIILKDYVRTILGMNRVDTLWNLDPRAEKSNAIFAQKIPEAGGNQVSAEFNLVYRWHSVVSERDEKWTQEAYAKLTGTTSEVSSAELLAALQNWAKSLPSDPQERPFADLQKDQYGNYLDVDLSSLWMDSVEDVSGVFGAQHVPRVLRSVEMLGIVQARSWNLASLNEFRTYFKLEPHKKFEDINPDPEIANALKQLYGTPDNVEIYPGIIVESTKPAMTPGSGLCTNFTISRAILSDAVALVRSDRFYTVDYTCQNLTNWGFEAANFDLDVDYGCVFHKLVSVALPHSFPLNSIYVHYPLVVPSENHSIMKRLKKDDQFTFDRPQFNAPPLLIRSEFSSAIFGDQSSKFRSAWPDVAYTLGRPAMTDSMPNDKSFSSILMADKDWHQAVRAFYGEDIRMLIQERQQKLGGIMEIDVLHNVLNVTHARFVATLLQVEDREIGHHSLLGLFGKLCEMMTMSAQANAVTSDFTKNVRKMGDLIKSRLSNAKGSWPKLMLGSSTATGVGKCGRRALSSFTKEMGAESKEQAAWSYLLPELASLVTMIARLSAQGLDTSLPDSTSGSDRHEQQALFARVAIQNLSIVKGEASIDVQAGQRLVCLANLEENVSPRVNPVSSAVKDNPTPMASVESQEINLAYRVSRICLTEISAALAVLRKVERYPGPQGRTKRVTDGRGIVWYMDGLGTKYSMIPESLKIRWKVSRRSVDLSQQ